MQGNARQCEAMQGNARQCKAMQGNTRQCKAMQCAGVDCGCIHSTHTGCITQVHGYIHIANAHAHDSDFVQQIISANAK